MKQQLTIVLCMMMLAGCKEEVKPYVSNDHEAPYINMTQYEFTTEVGQTLNFSNVTGYDDVDGLLPVTLTGYVDYSTPGDYYPSFTCRDTSGNETSIPITIHVIEAGASEEEQPVSDQPEAAPSATPSGCDAEGAEDRNLPCKTVTHHTAVQYDVLYEGEEGLSACLAGAGNEESCEAVYANDGSLWGYGLKK